MEYPFERLEIYKLAVNLVKLIYKVADSLPKREEYVLKAQLLRASTSIVLNISEGNGRRTVKEKLNFINIALGSLQETISIIKLLVDLEELKTENILEIELLEEKLYFKLVAFRKSLSTF